MCPTKSGYIVERRYQVLITSFFPLSFRACTFLSNLSKTKGPFFKLLDIRTNPFYLFLRDTINFSLAFFVLRVLSPRAGLPHGVIGPFLPTGALPSPPP